jgi:hypothetical protein
MKDNWALLCWHDTDGRLLHAWHVTPEQAETVEAVCVVRFAPIGDEL